MNSKYVDTSAVIQVIGNIYKDPTLLDLTDKYVFIDEDFSNEFHKIVFGTIYKLHDLGAKKITLENILDFLSSRPKAEAVFKENKGLEWLAAIEDKVNVLAFDYYYDRLKKMTLLRAFDERGIDVTNLYDPNNILDTKKKEQQEEFLDNTPIDEIANKVFDSINEIKSKYVHNNFERPQQAGEGIFDLIDSLKETPEIGVPLYGALINTVTRGARLKKFYLRSAGTGIGKSRSMVADACYIACDKIYDDNFGWIKNGISQPVLFITTEQELNEVQTMMIAFLSNVNESHILNGYYIGDEEVRVREAARIINESPIYVIELPDFSLRDIEDNIRNAVRDLDVSYVFLDYLHTSMKILEEITKRSGGVKLREDNILFMMSIKLKDLCNELGIFIMSATQLNAGMSDYDVPDQSLLRGAKSIADKVDYGSILLGVREKDYQALEKILNSGCFEKPNLKLSVYKNRRGEYKGVYLWCKANLGSCRIDPMFCTTFDYELINMENISVIVDDE